MTEATIDRVLASGPNRVRHRVYDFEPPEYPLDWTVQEDPEPDRDLWRTLRHRARFTTAEPRMPPDPVRAALCVVEDRDIARLRVILTQEMQAAATALQERLNRAVEERVDAVLKERAEAHLRASVLVQDFISQLREKAAGVPLPPPEEAWKHVDFAAVYEEEEGEE